jgi:hypothetical protein
MNQRTPTHVIDPAKPFGSVTAGPQQFTFLGDFDHTNPELMKTVRDNVKEMAQSGVKHIMLEMTEDPRSRVLLNYINKMPSLVSDKSIMAEAPNFALSNPKTPEDQKLSGEYIAGVLVEAKNNGMKVHFVNDHRGMPEGDVADKLIQKRDEYVLRHMKADPVIKAWMNDPEGKVPELKGSPEIQQKTLERLNKFAEGLMAQNGPIDEAQAKYREARMGTAAETARAEKIVTLANGEMAAVMFGAGHFIKDKDLNELVDARAKQVDPSRPYAPSVVMSLYGSKAHAVRDEPLYENMTQPDLKYYVREKQIKLTASGSQTMTLKGAAPSLQAGQGISFGSLEQMATSLAGVRGQSSVAKPDEPDISKTSSPNSPLKPKPLEFGM